MLKKSVILLVIFVFGCYFPKSHKYSVDYLTDIPYKNQYAYAELFEILDSGKLKIDSVKVLYTDFITDTSTHLTDTTKQYHPNPFSPTYKFDISVEQEKNINIGLLTVRGDSIPLYDRVFDPGNYELDLSNSYLNAGVYYMKINEIVKPIYIAFLRDK